MIHKFWNVRLAQPADSVPALESTDDAAGRDLIREEEERMEEKVFRIWSVLSTFEESSAACISDMLLHVSNGSYVEGVFVAKRFIWHVEILFQSADRLDATMVGLDQKGKNALTLKSCVKSNSMLRHVLRARSQIIMQEDCFLLLSAFKNAGQRNSQAWSYTRAPISCYWSCPLSQAPYPNLSSGCTAPRA
jgi:hypothetical protein